MRIIVVKLVVCTAEFYIFRWHPPFQREGVCPETSFGLVTFNPSGSISLSVIQSSKSPGFIDEVGQRTFNIRWSSRVVGGPHF